MTMSRDYLTHQKMSVHDALEAPVTELLDVSNETAKVLSQSLRIKTIRDLAESPYFDFASEVKKSMTQVGHKFRRMGVPGNKVVKEWEGHSVADINQGSISVIEGIGPKGREEIEKNLKVQNVGQLADWQPYVNAKELLQDALKEGGVQHKTTVEGQLFNESASPASETSVKLYQVLFGGEKKLLTTAKTNQQGFYAVEFDSPQAINVEIWSEDSKGKEIKLCNTKYGVNNQATINLVAPAILQSKEAEYERLNNDLKSLTGGTDKLADAQETDQQRDLTLINRETGWDARLLALSAMAAKNAKSSGLPTEVLYGLYRVGLPTSLASLAKVSVTGIEKALQKAISSNIVKLTSKQISSVKGKFSSFAVSQLSDTTPAGGASTYNDFLALTDLKKDEQEILTGAFFSGSGDAAQLWDTLKNKGISDNNIAALKLQGKLGFLTHSSAPVAKALLERFEFSDDLDALVTEGFYDAVPWRATLKEILGSDDKELDKGIPGIYSGDTSQRLNAYSEDMARKVRLSYPTQTVAVMVSKQELKLGKKFDGQQRAVSEFLMTAKKLDAEFELGQTSISSFVKIHKSPLSDKLSANEFEKVIEGTKMLSRVFQMSPSNNAMQVLMDLELTSAQRIAPYTEPKFMNTYGGHFGNEREARLVHRKAQQIYAVTFNFFTAAKQLDATSGMYALSPPQALIAQTKNDISNRFPTMESLFGSMDFCECNHCASVLSPAAYFVDLLQFIDPDQLAWRNFLSHWKNKHQGKEYQGDWRLKPDMSRRTEEQRTPYDALLERRPDLVHMPLTCENTHTSIPYIDVVNEILEFYLVRGKLTPEVSYDTGDAPAELLLAEPQNILPDAYETLNEDAVYPLNLPFNLWLETVREFVAYFDVGFADVLETFRSHDELFLNADDYGRNAVLMESLKISPQEYAIFTMPEPQNEWFTLYGYNQQNTEIPATPEAKALQELSSAKTLSRRLGLSYQELIDIVQTWFVNPDLHNLVTLRKLEVDTIDVFRYKAHPDFARFTLEETQAFEARLDALTQEYAEFGFDARQWLDSEWQKNAFDNIVILKDDNAGCNFEATTLCYADGRPADDILLHKINLFVRLWRKLNWEMAEFDSGLQALIPTNLVPLTLANAGAAMGSVLVYLAHLQNLDTRLKPGKGARRKLVCLWSDLSTTGLDPLYQELFLTPGVLENAIAFDHPLGQYLTTPDVFVSAHLSALQAGTGLGAEDLSLILSDMGTDMENATLSIGLVSNLYRYSLLASASKLSVEELIALKQISGLNPFNPVESDALQRSHQDHPYHQTLAFVELREQLQTLGITVADLQYLVQHHVASNGPYADSVSAPIALYKSLSEGLQRILTEHPGADDPAVVTDDVIVQKLSLVFSPDVVEAFVGLWTGTASTAAELPVLPADQLNPEDYADEADLELRYDGVLQRQILIFRGVLLNNRKAQLAAAHPTPLFGQLLDSIDNQNREFFRIHFVDTGFFTELDYDVLFDVREIGRRQLLLASLLSFVRYRLGTEHVLQVVNAQLDGDSVLLNTLATQAQLLSDPAARDVTISEVLSEAVVSGISVQFYASNNAQGAELAQGVVNAISPQAQFAGQEELAVPQGTNSAVFEGYLEVPVSGAYRLFASGAGGAQLSFSHLVDPLFMGAINPDGGLVELQSGVPYQFSLVFTELNSADFALEMLGANAPRQNLGSYSVFPAATVDRVWQAWLRLSKSVLLANLLNIPVNELSYILQNSSDFDLVDLRLLPTEEAGVLDNELVSGIRALMDYASLKKELGDTEQLASLLQLSRRVFDINTDGEIVRQRTQEAVFAQLAEITGQQLSTAEQAAAALGLNVTIAEQNGDLRASFGAFNTVSGINGIWRVLQLVSQLQVSPSVLAQWANPNPNFELARQLKNALRAHFDTNTWYRVSQTVFDVLRAKQRDALAAKVMFDNGFERIEQLYEYFLIDPGMEPVVKSSRLLLATASVQLFVQRCLMNLEENVHASAIDSEQWQWMKRYRVWEANRKIWLFPENFLEPEFRDDKTHLFRELESTLLQDDIDEQSAENAFFHYLKQLEVMARLQMVSMYAEENPLDPGANKLHVIGRTFNQPYQYYYRTYSHQMWTPWEPVGIEIEGDHVAIAMWRGRLHLFWVTFLERSVTPLNTSGSDRTIENIAGNSSLANILPDIYVDAQLNWADYTEGEWAAMEGGEFTRLNKNVGKTFDPAEVFVHLSKQVQGGNETSITIHLSEPLRTSIKLASKNSAPVVADPAEPLHVPFQVPYIGTERRTTEHRDRTELQVEFLHYFSDRPSEGAARKKQQTILERGDGPRVPAFGEVNNHDTSDYGFGLLSTVNKLNSPDVGVTDLITPFFYQDSQNSFFVEPSLREIKTPDWNFWVPSEPEDRPELEIDDYWDDFPVEERVPLPIPEPEPRGPGRPGVGPRGPGWVDPVPEVQELLDNDSVYPVRPGRDWATNPATILQFEQGFIGFSGGQDPLVGSALNRVNAQMTNAAVMQGEHVNAIEMSKASAQASNVIDNIAQDKITELSSNGLNVVTDSGLNNATMSALVSGVFNNQAADGNGRF